MSASIAPAVLEKAAAPGRMRGIATSIWSDAVADRRRGGAALRDGLRAAKALHSRERRWVAEALYAMVRRERLYAFAVGADDPDALWLAWLVEQGLPLAAAQAQHPAAFSALVDGSCAARLAALSPLAQLGVQHGLPSAFLDRLPDGDEAAALCAAMDARAPVTVRANRLRTHRDALRERLAAEGVASEPCVRAADGLHLVGRVSLPMLESYREGWFEVQDEGSQRLAGLLPGQGLVIDWCAGAGGKSLALASAGCDVIAADVRDRPLRELERRASRAGASIRTARHGRDRLPTADAVFVDAPCTGSGVLRRHPEHRWVIDEASVAASAARQRRILEQAAASVRPGGRLVYGTCSLFADENESVVRGFLEGNKDFEPVGPALRTAPHLDGADGFFGQLLERRGSVALHSTTGPTRR